MQKMILGGLMAVMAAAFGVANDARADDAPYCREYQQQVTIGGVLRNIYGTACQQADGSWQKVDQQPEVAAQAEDVQVVQYQQPIYVQQPVVYEEPVYYRPYYGPGIGLSFGFDDWHGGHGSGGWHGGHGGWHGGGHWR